MSLPDFIECQCPLPDPEMQGLGFNCENINGWMGAIYTITKDGRIEGGSTNHQDENGKFNLTGNLKLYRSSKSGELFFYLAHFIDGQLQSIRRPDLLTFESTPPNSYAYTYYCEQLGSNNGTIFRITRDGQIFKPDSGYIHYHGDLIFYPAIGTGWNHKYIARFDQGQIQTLEEIKEGSEIRETLRIFSQNQSSSELERESER